MTDRHAGYVVTLEGDIREDDSEAVLNALRMVKGVVGVEPVVVDPELHIAHARAERAIKQRVLEALK